MQLKRQVLVGSLWSAFGNSGQQIIGFLIFIYIARLLTPAEVGLVAFAMVLVEVLTFVSRLGQVEVLQRNKDLPDTTISTSFWILVAMGLLSTALVLVAAQFAGLVSDNPDFPLVVALLAPFCALQAFNALPEALLRRRLDYRSLSFRNWIAALSGGAVGVYLAYRGYGVFALVAQRVGTALVQTICTWLFLRWHPRLTFDRAAAKTLFVSGGEIMLAGFAGSLNQRVADAVAGTTLGASALGFLRLGWRFFEVLVTLSVNPVVNVALTTFGRLQQDLPALRRAYLRLTQFMATGSLPVFFGLGAVADVLIPLVFGEKWMGSVMVIELLGFIVLGTSVNVFFAPVMIAVGKSRLLLGQSLFQLVVTVLFVLAGSMFGLVGVMIGFIARGIAVAAYNLFILSREAKVDPRQVIGTVLPPAVASAVMVGVVEIAKFQLVGRVPDIPLLLILIAAGAATYGVALFGGDLVGLWRGYVRDAVASILGAFKGGGPKPKEVPA
jgi:PST family polysaccharide transporter